MAVGDLGYILFVEFLRMTQYPGAPFTGEIIRDLVMFFFIPTVFIILIVYMLLGRILPPAHVKLRALLGIAIYAFIIFGGYYPVFAYLAGPYFIFLIFILGILYYFLEHFTRRGGGGGGSPYRGASHAATGGSMPTTPHYEGMNRHQLLDQEERLKARIKILNRQVSQALSKGETRNEGLRSELATAETDLSEVKEMLRPVKKPRF